MTFYLEKMFLTLTNHSTKYDHPIQHVYGLYFAYKINVLGRNIQLNPMTLTSDLENN